MVNEKKIFDNSPISPPDDEEQHSDDDEKVDAAYGRDAVLVDADDEYDDEIDDDEKETRSVKRRKLSSTSSSSSTLNKEAASHDSDWTSDILAFQIEPLDGSADFKMRLHPSARQGTRVFAFVWFCLQLTRCFGRVRHLFPLLFHNIVVARRLFCRPIRHLVKGTRTRALVHSPWSRRSSNCFV